MYGLFRYAETQNIVNYHSVIPPLIRLPEVIVLAITVLLFATHTVLTFSNDISGPDVRRGLALRY